MKDVPAAHVQPWLVQAYYDGGVVLPNPTPMGGTTAYPVDPARVG